MTAHKHAAMIKAKADNMDLVVFIQHDQTEWEQVLINKNCIPSFDPDFNYFLCLPQHKEACLHWLNGGEIEYDNMKNWIAYDLTIDNPKYPLQDFTGLEFNFRIKPRKEKRHIYISKLGATTYAKKTKEEAAREVSIMGGSFYVWKHYEIEIEVEV